jgi:GAF domain-containing protein
VSEPADLAALFAAVARELEAEPGPERTYGRITAVARESIQGCDHAAISLVRRRGGITTVAATDEVPPAVDRLQYLLGEGPCIAAITDHAVYRSGDLSTDARWPRFGPQAYAEIGVQSMLSFQLSVHDDVIGGLNLYSRKPDVFDDHARAVGAVLATHAAIAMSAAHNEQRVEQLGAAVQTNRRIGMAVGILMARRHLTEEQAFAQLRRASQHLNVKIREIAEDVVDTGEIPDRRR